MQVRFASWVQVRACQCKQDAVLSITIEFEINAKDVSFVLEVWASKHGQLKAVPASPAQPRKQVCLSTIEECAGTVSHRVCLDLQVAG